MSAQQAKRQRQRAARRRRGRITGSRVPLQGPSQPCEIPGDPDEADKCMAAWLAQGERELRRVIHPVVRLTADGPDWGVEPSAGDQIGYAMHPWRNDDCLRAAIATATQVAIEEVPDLRLDERLDEDADPEELSRECWERIEAWAASRSLAMTWWTEMPVPRERWIAISAGTDENNEDFLEGVEFGDHCLVMNRDRILFDPSCSLALPPGTEIRKHSLSSISFGLSFDKEAEG